MGERNLRAGKGDSREVEASELFHESFMLPSVELAKIWLLGNRIAEQQLEVSHFERFNRRAWGKPSVVKPIDEWVEPQAPRLIRSDAIPDPLNGSFRGSLPLVETLA